MFEGKGDKKREVNKLRKDTKIKTCFRNEG